MLLSKMCIICGKALPESTKVGAAYCPGAGLNKSSKCRQQAYRNRLNEKKQEGMYMKIDDDHSIFSVPTDKITGDTCGKCGCITVIDAGTRGDRNVTFCPHCQTIMSRRQ